MILRDFMTPSPLALLPDDSLAHAAEIMAWTESHHVPVTSNDGRLVGVLSEHDILAYRVEHPNHDLRETPLGAVMKRTPQTASADTSLTEAAARLALNQIGCLPVTQRGHLIGLVTRTDVLNAAFNASMKSRSQLLVSDVMSPDPVTACPDDFLFDAGASMGREGVRHLPVVEDGGKVVGILSDRDVQALIRNPEEFVAFANTNRRDLRVRNAMSKPALRVFPHENCASASAFFVQFHASAAPVTTEAGILVGMLSYVDLLRGLTQTVAKRVVTRS